LKIQEINGESKFHSKEFIKRRKKIKKRIFWIKFILITIISITAVVFLALSPVFNIKVIEVEGVQHYKQGEIIDSTNLILGENGFKTIGNSIGNLLTLRYGLEEKNIVRKFPYVKSVYVRFILPNKIKISIIERKPIAYINYNGTFLYIDNEAYVLNSVPKLDIKDIPEVKGMKFLDFKLGQALKVDEKKCIESFNIIYNAIIECDKTDSYKIFSKLKYIDVSDLQKITIFLDSRLEVNFGDLYDLSYRLDFMKKSIVAIPKGAKGLLDMTLEEPVLKPY
jgi:cell division protein FtsQ